jgi:hypothetical protein
MKDGILALRRLSFRAALWVSFKSPSEADWQDSNRYSIRRRVTPGQENGIGCGGRGWWIQERSKGVYGRYAGLI